MDRSVAVVGYLLRMTLRPLSIGWLGAILGLLACHRKGRGSGITGATERIRTLFIVTGVDGLIPPFGSAEIVARELAKSASA